MPLINEDSDNFNDFQNKFYAINLNSPTGCPVVGSLNTVPFFACEKIY